MKRILVAGVVLMSAILANAASVTWSVTEGLEGLDGTAAYLFVGSDSSGVAEAIQKGTLDYSSALATTTTDDGEIFKSKIGDYSNTTVSLYMVVFDSAEPSSTAKFKVSSPVSLTFGVSGNKTAEFSESISSATWTPVTPTPIPEPTSVALLALGLAALGLKRKVA